MTKTSPRFWDKRATSYAKQDIQNVSAYEHKLQLTQNIFPQQASVLEVGCGTGATAMIHSEHVERIRGIDYSCEMIRIAEQRLAKSDSVGNVKFSVDTIETLNDSEQFDVILALNLLHLVPDRKSFYQHVEKHLKPGGHFVVSTPCLGGKFKWLIRAMAIVGIPLGIMPAVSLFDFPAHRDEIEMRGFITVEHWDQNDGRNHFMIFRKRTR